ncbi:MAG: metallophosphoesterase, partial [Pseudobutyrivibrio sp.]|nr:metallophosphoesterase [Pseudobutyrivibrio sp.]
MIFFNGGTGKDKEKSLVYAEYGAIDPVDIWLATDTHYIAPELTDNGQFYQKMVNSGDGKYMYGCEELTDAFIEEVVEAHPTALILAGDLTFNGAKISHEAFAQKISPIEQAGIPIIAIPGNHDLTINRAAKFHGNDYELFDSIDATEYIDIYGEYGLNEAIARDDTSLSYVTEIAPNLRVIVVDVNTVPGMSGILTKATLEFVEEQLIDAANNHAYVIGVTHQTLLVHSELTSQGITFINNDK